MAPNLITLSVNIFEMHDVRCTMCDARTDNKIMQYQGLVCVFFNFASLLYYNPTLACGSKPLHVSKGGLWDPWLAPIDPTTTFEGFKSWLGLGRLLSSHLGLILTTETLQPPRPISLLAPLGGSTLLSPLGYSYINHWTLSMASKRDGREQVAH